MSDEVPSWVRRHEPTLARLYHELCHVCAMVDDMPLWYRVYDDFEIRSDTRGRVATPEAFEELRALICAFGHREAIEARLGSGTLDELLAARRATYEEYVEACRANDWRPLVRRPKPQPWRAPGMDLISEAPAVGKRQVASPPR